MVLSFISLPSILYLWISLVPLISNYMFIYLFCCSLFLAISSIRFYRRLCIIDQNISSPYQSACYLLILSNYLVNHLMIFAVIFWLWCVYNPFRALNFLPEPRVTHGWDSASLSRGNNRTSLPSKSKQGAGVSQSRNWAGIQEMFVTWMKSGEPSLKHSFQFFLLNHGLCLEFSHSKQLFEWKQI